MSNFALFLIAVVVGFVTNEAIRYAASRAKARGTSPEVFAGVAVAVVIAVIAVAAVFEIMGG